MRAWFLEAVRTECPEAVQDLWTAVFVPLSATLTPSDAVALLTRRTPSFADVQRGSQHRVQRAAIVRWARRWQINAPWIREQAWRTLRFWVVHPEAVGGPPPRWAPVINTDTGPRRAAARGALRPRNDRVLTWLVRLRVCRLSVEMATRATDGGGHVDADSVRVQVNRLAKTLDLAVRGRGRPRRSPSASRPS